MNRRQLLSAILGAPFANKPAYRPCGHISVERGTISPGSPKRVTVDGLEIRYVFEIDDLEGWVRRYAHDERGRLCPLRPEVVRGEVRVFW